jgi:hypothetical protein
MIGQNSRSARDQPQPQALNRSMISGRSMLPWFLSLSNGAVSANITVDRAAAAWRQPDPGGLYESPRKGSATYGRAQLC